MAFVTVWNCVSLSIIVLAYLVRTGKDTFLNDLNDLMAKGCLKGSKETYLKVYAFFRWLTF